jgi:hypothetical protein
MVRRATIKVPHKRITGSQGKKTSIGRGNVGFSTMNKNKKNSYKKYRGQGK